MSDDQFEDILATRYSSNKMASLFSSLRRVRIWRDVWIALAEAERELGAPITEDQIYQMRATRDLVELDRIEAIEKETKHDVVANIKAWGELAPDAAPIIHLGATSALVTDNADLIVQKEALGLVRNRVVQLIRELAHFAAKNASTPAVGYTHFQAAQPITIGKRASMWLQDILMDFNELVNRIDNLKCLGAKGATGTQASFLELFNGDKDKVNKLDQLLGSKLGFSGTIPISGQTYTRKIDVQIADILANIGVSLHKMGTDLRLLAHTGEVREAFSAKQVGSSAMPYKRNPMQAERLCALSRLLTNYRDAIVQTTATQWLERSLDDSAGRRISIPDQFMAVDGALRVATSLVSKLEVDKTIVNAILADETPFMAVEQILAKGVEAGLNRQALHERLRNYMVEAKQAGITPGLTTGDMFFSSIMNDRQISALNLSELLDVKKMVGCAPQQVKNFLDDIVFPILTANQDVPEFGDAVQK